ncbi:MAG: hypothetical protein M3Z25_17400 [Actinomycetota bacterium]|nr:hypothetical protein [Actinomycetota bacterium]
MKPYAEHTPRLVAQLLAVALGWLFVVAQFATAAKDLVLRMQTPAADCRECDLNLLALRALTTVPVRRLRAVSADPAAAWRRNDPDVASEVPTGPNLAMSAGGVESDAFWGR